MPDQSELDDLLAVVPAAPQPVAKAPDASALEPHRSELDELLAVVPASPQPVAAAPVASALEPDRSELDELLAVVPVAPQPVVDEPVASAEAAADVAAALQAPPALQPVPPATVAGPIPARKDELPAPEASSKSRTKVIALAGAGLLLAAVGAAFIVLKPSAPSAGAPAAPTVEVAPAPSLPEAQTPASTAPAAVPEAIAPVAAEPARPATAPAATAPAAPGSVPAEATAPAVRGPAAQAAPAPQRPAPAAKPAAGKPAIPADEKSQALLSRAEQYLQRAQFDKAIATAENILDLEPDNRAARVLLEKAKAKQLEALRNGSSIE